MNPCWRNFFSWWDFCFPAINQKSVDKNRSLVEEIRARPSWVPLHLWSLWSIYVPSSCCPVLCHSLSATGERRSHPAFHYLGGDDSPTLFNVAMVTARHSALASSPTSLLSTLNHLLSPYLLKSTSFSWFYLCFPHKDSDLWDSEVSFLVLTTLKQEILFICLTLLLD